MAWTEKTRSGTFRVGWMDETGQHYKGGFATKQDAARYVTRIESDGAPSGLTLNEYAGQVFDSSFDLRGSTLYAYRKTFQKHVADKIGRKTLGDLSTDDMRRYFTDLEAGPSAQASVYRVVAKVLNSAEREGVIGKSPLRPIRKPKDTRRREVRPLPIEDIEALASAVNPYFRLAVLLAGYAGLRGGEIGGLRLSDVDIENRQIQVVQATARHGGQRVLGEVKTAAGRRRIDVPEFLVQECVAHFDRFGTAPDGRLFQTSEGNLVVNQTLDGALQKAATLSFTNGEAKVRFHDLRHTCAALMVAQGAHPKMIQQHMGHSSISITLDVYGHLFPSLGRDVADALGEARARSNEEER